MSIYTIEQIMLLGTSPTQAGTDHGFAIMAQLPADGEPDFAVRNLDFGPPAAGLRINHRVELKRR